MIITTKLTHSVAKTLIPKLLFWKRFNKKQKLYFHLILGALFVILIPLLITTSQQTKTVQAAWLDDNWAYRKTINATVTSSSSDISNLQTLLTIDTSTGANGIASGKIQSSCQDLRFTNVTGKLLPYYIDSGCNTTTTKIWVMADLVPKNTTTYTMYMYYGNPSAAAGSNSQPYFDNVVNLKGYWTMNESSGATVKDSSITANNGTATGTTVTTHTTFSNARTFPGGAGDTDYVTVSDHANLNPTTQITIEAWVYQAASQSDKQIVIKNMTNGNGGYRLSATTGGRFYINLPTSGFNNTLTTAAAYSTGAWHHVAATYDGANIKIYVDGQLDNSVARTGNIGTGDGTTSLYFGRYTLSSANANLNGNLDDVKIYSTARTAAQILNDYNNTLPNGTSINIASTAVGTSGPSTSFATEEKTPASTLYWKFDDGTGTNAQDSTSNNLDGTLNNTPTWQTEDQCIAGKCLYFNGTTNMNVSKSDDAKLDFAAADSFTVSAWVKRNGASSANNFIITKAQSGYTGYKLYQDASGDYCFDVSDGTNTDTACTSAIDFDDDKWHLVQGVKSGTSSLTLYVDGAQRAQDASIAATGTLANTGTFYIGVDLDGTSNEWLGFIDEVKVYPYARSAAQVKTDYSSRGSTEGSSSNLSSSSLTGGSINNGLVSYWKMDEAAGATDAIDSSGNANTGTYTSGATTTTGKFGNGGSFDGTNDYIAVANTASVKNISYWIKPTASAYSVGLSGSKRYLLNNGLYSGTNTATRYINGAVPTSESLGSELLTNGTIESGAIGPWWQAIQGTGGATGALSTTTSSPYAGTYSLDFNITNGGNSQGDMQVYHNSNFSLTSGTLYKVQFAAKGSSAISGLQATPRIAGTPYTELGVNYNFDITTSWVLHTYYFYATATRSDAQFFFYVGNHGAFRFYLDNISIKPVSSVGDVTNSAWNFVSVNLDSAVTADSIALAQVNSRFLQGTIDEVRLYNRSLSTAEISQLYNFAPGPIAHYTFDDNTGSSVKDSSGNASTGTWVGSNTHWTPGKFGSGGNITAGSDYVTSTLSQTVDPATTGTVSFWAKDSTSNTWNFYTIAGGTSYVNGIATSFTNKYYNISSTALQIGAGNTVIIPNDSTLSSNLKLWLKADQITGKKQGDTITTWSDQSGVGNNATATGGVTYQTNQQNGLPVVRFDGSTGQATVNGIVSHVRNDSTYLAVLKLRSFNGINPHSALFFSGGGGFWDPFRAHPGGTWRVFRYDGGANNTELTSTIEDTNTSIFRVLTNLHSGNTTSLWQNGTIGINAGTQGGTIPTTAAVIAGTNDGGVRGNYDIAEMVVYSDDLATASRTSLETYLGCKYNLSISGFTNGCLTGVIDDFKVYNYVRTQKQIVEDMNGGHPSVGSPVGSAVAHWKFDEGYLTTANDSSINSNSLTLSAASWTNSGKFNKAWNGTGSVWLSRADDADFDFAAADDLAISLWFKSDSATNPSTTEYLLDKESSSAGYAVYATTSGTICFGIDDDATWTPDDSACSTNDIYDNTWHHIVATKTGTSRIDLYVDGISTASDTSLSATGTLANSDSLVLGDRDASNGTDEFNGDLDEVKIYRYALTADEVKIDMNRSSSQVLGTLSDKSTYEKQAASQEYCIPGDSTSCASPIAEWKFDEKQGTTANDSSGNAHTGTWQGTTTSLWKPGKYGTGGNFNGTNNYLTLANFADFGVNAATISFWVKSTNDNSGVVFTAGTGTNNVLRIGQNSAATLTNELIMFRRSNNAHTGSTELGYTTSTRTELFDGKWHFVTMTFSGSSGGTKIYLDGVSKTVTQGVGSDEGKFVGGTGVTVTAAAIGKSDFDGTVYLQNGTVLDQLRFYNYVRTPAQIAWEYNRGVPVGHWMFDECQGSVANDSSGNSNTGTITPGAGTNTAVGTCTGSANTMWKDGVTGKYNSSLDFDGTDDKVAISTTPITDTSAWTMSAWIKPASLSQNGIVMYNNTGSMGFGIGGVPGEFAGATLRGIYDGVAWLITSYTFTDTINWHHVVMTRSGSTTTFYIDGRTLTGTTNSTATPTGSSTGASIGNSGSIRYFNGQIDEAQMYNYALTATQIKNLYNQGSAVRFGPSTGTP